MNIQVKDSDHEFLYSCKYIVHFLSYRWTTVVSRKTIVEMFGSNKARILGIVR